MQTCAGPSLSQHLLTLKGNDRGEEHLEHRLPEHDTFWRRFALITGSIVLPDVHG